MISQTKVAIDLLSPGTFFLLLLVTRLTSRPSSLSWVAASRHVQDVCDGESLTFPVSAIWEVLYIHCLI